ncbi:ABC transporter ATP-binding protein [Paroceanicella profunda]|uniref:ABC transporter ATP-binding protein n=1 Tax=Paroceanicella profunda TaxID=2579971 RepID=A0A5B8G0N2_9RHOB|nr:ABC transporter ATP-binding protein [Paroceanicella profunda]QDL93330.1 ABC transporter ATP-binding protein [Paroceanicella profunda]
MTQPISLDLRGVSKSYGPVQALLPLDLSVRPGELLSLLGPSGCGKTTTLRIIAGFETPDYGDVLIGGTDVTELPPDRRRLGMMFQSYGLFPHMSVLDNVAFGLKMRNVPRAERHRQAGEMLERVHLGGYRDRMIAQLSGGQQQRVALARALVTNPSILLLDEPLGALDKNLREHMQFELREIQRSLGITTILVTHDQEEALTMSDRVAVMQGGAVRQIGAPTEIYMQPKSRFVSEFLGASNIFTVRPEGAPVGGSFAARVGPENGLVRVASNGQEIGTAPLSVAIRPEHLRLVPAGEAALQGRLRSVIFRGSFFACEVMLPGQDRPILVYTQTSTDLPAPGSPVGVDWPEGRAVAIAESAA